MVAMSGRAASRRCAVRGTTHPPVWVGIDVGTQSVRVYALSSSGEVVGRGAVALRGRRDGERHEQDPRTWWPAVAAASRAALLGVAPERVRGVATCATSGTILLVDRDGEPLTPALMYDDGRAAAQAAAIDARRVFEHRISPSWALAKLHWMLGAWPDLAAGRAARSSSRRRDARADRSRGRVGLQPRAEERLRPARTSHGRRRRSSACPASCCRRSCARARALGEVCAAAAAHRRSPWGRP